MRYEDIFIKALAAGFVMAVFLLIKRLNVQNKKAIEEVQVINKRHDVRKKILTRIGNDYGKLELSETDKNRLEELKRKASVNAVRLNEQKQYMELWEQEQMAKEYSESGKIIL